MFGKCQEWFMVRQKNGFLTQSVFRLDVFGAFGVEQVVVGDPLQVEVLVAQVVLATEKEDKLL